MSGEREQGTVKCTAPSADSIHRAPFGRRRVSSRAWWSSAGWARCCRARQIQLYHAAHRAHQAGALPPARGAERALVGESAGDGAAPPPAARQATCARRLLRSARQRQIAPSCSTARYRPDARPFWHEIEPCAAILSRRAASIVFTIDGSQQRLHANVSLLKRDVAYQAGRSSCPSCSSSSSRSLEASDNDRKASGAASSAF